MIINHNISALNTHRQLGANNNAVQGSLEKLSSGLQINRAGDDAAGLAISEKMRGQIRGLDMAAKNAQDGISLIQTAEGALNETHDILQRMRELAVQSSNDTNTDADRAELQNEVDALAKELTRISDNTEFNTQNLLDGKFEATFHIGANADQNLGISIDNMGADALGVNGAAAGLQVGVEVTEASQDIDDLALADGKSYNVVKLDEAVDVKDTDTGGEKLSGVQYTLNDADGNIVGVSKDGEDWHIAATGDAKSDINDLDLKASAVVFSMGEAVTSGTIKAESTNSGADTTLSATATVEFDADSKGLAAGEYTVVSDDNVFVPTNQIGLTNSKGDLVAVSKDGTDGQGAGAQTFVDLDGNDLFKVTDDLGVAGDKFTVAGGGGIDISSQAAADKAITTIQDSIDSVSSQRSALGAVQNRLEHTINNLGASSENLTAAESRIRDVDMAKEMMNFTKNNILTQASQAMLAQANQMPQGVLQLLQ